MVALHREPPALAYDVQHLLRPRAAVNQIAQEENCVRRIPVDVIDNDFERGQVTVNVAQNGETQWATHVDSAAFSGSLSFTKFSRPVASR